MAYKQYFESYHRPIFIGGMHKSGTTAVCNLLAGCESVSALSSTGVPENEGQHLLSVLKSDQYFGEILFPLSEGARADKVAETHRANVRAVVLGDLSTYWDFTKPYLVEKSPINMMRTPFLHSLFPKAKFIITYRDPRISFMATRKNCPHLEFELYLRAWKVAYEIAWCDSLLIDRHFFLNFDELLTNNIKELAALSLFTGIEPELKFTVPIESKIYKYQWNTYYADLPTLTIDTLSSVVLPYQYKIREFDL